MATVAAERVQLTASTVRRLVLVGYSGRDQDAVAAHVAELASHGVPAPESVPAVWEVPPALITQADAITVAGDGTSGEAEPVLVFGLGNPRLAVGSDHTDRDLERTDMTAAKRACAKVISTESWPLPNETDWDQIELSSQVLVNGAWRDYQRASLATMLPASWFADRFAGDGVTVVFCGTIPTLDGLVTDATEFRAQLTAADGERLVCHYRIARG